MEASLSPADLTALIVHEGTEVEWMVKKGWDYETAHDRSSCFERALRLRLERGELPVRTRGQAVAVAKQVLTTILSRP